MTRAWRGWAVVIGYLLATTAGIVVQAGPADRAGMAEGVALYGGFGLFAVLGAVLLTRRPGHVMGTLFAGMALVVAVGSAGEAYAGSQVLAGREPPLVVRLLAWPNAWYWYMLLALLLCYVPLLFPDGRLPSPRWRWFAWAVGLTVTVTCVVAGLSERIQLQTVGPDGEQLSVANPLGITGMPFLEQNPWFPLLTAPFVAGLAGAIAAVIVRFRRATGIERQQLKWFVAAVCVQVVTFVISILPIPGADIISTVGLVVGIVGVPVAITLAILRFRLYDIDRIISRTVTYALVSAVLLGIYATVVTLPGTLFALESDVLVAAATLTAAAVFVPLRRRLQQAVDRRFNRARYDARRVVERFAGRLRDDIDLDDLAGDLHLAVTTTVQPSHQSLWLRRTRDVR